MLVHINDREYFRTTFAISFIILRLVFIERTAYCFFTIAGFKLHEKWDCRRYHTHDIMVNSFGKLCSSTSLSSKFCVVIKG